MRTSLMPRRRVVPHSHDVTREPLTSACYPRNRCRWGTCFPPPLLPTIVLDLFLLPPAASLHPQVKVGHPRCSVNRLPDHVYRFDLALCPTVEMCLVVACNACRHDGVWGYICLLSLTGAQLHVCSGIHLGGVTIQSVVFPSCLP